MKEKYKPQTFSIFEDQKEILKELRAMKLIPSYMDFFNELFEELFAQLKRKHKDDVPYIDTKGGDDE